MSKEEIYDAIINELEYQKAEHVKNFVEGMAIENKADKIIKILEMKTETDIRLAEIYLNTYITVLKEIGIAIKELRNTLKTLLKKESK